MSAHLTLTLIRHASHGEVGRRLSGRRPGLSLSPDGRAEAARLAASFRGQAVDALATSPLERCRETAAAISDVVGCPAREADALVEIDFGTWTGCAFSDLDRDPAWRAWNEERAEACPPGGEPMRAVQDRMVAQIEAWRSAHPGGAVVAVSHADVIKAAICHVLGLSLDRHAAFEVDPASRSTVVTWAGGGKVVSLNQRAAA